MFDAWWLVRAYLRSFVNKDLWWLLLDWFQNCSLLPLVWVDADEEEEKPDTDDDLDLKESFGKHSLSLTALDPGENELVLTGVFLGRCSGLLVTDCHLPRVIALALCWTNIKIIFFAFAKLSPQLQVKLSLKTELALLSVNPAPMLEELSMICTDNSSYLIFFFSKNLRI
jgi:hypothetical protein